MTLVLARAWREEDGVLSFEWTMLLTLLTIGIVSGIAAARDGVIDELGDVAQAMLSVDGSYRISQPLAMVVDLEGKAFDPVVVRAAVELHEKGELALPSSPIQM